MRILPTGYWKGSGLAILLDTLAALLSEGLPTNGIDKIQKGSCTGCPSSGVTLKSHVETMLVHYVSQVTEVRMSGEECVELDSAELEVGKKPVY